MTGKDLGRKLIPIIFLTLPLSAFCAPDPSPAQPSGVSEPLVKPLITRELQKIVVVSRHGVRAPTQSQSTLASWSPKPWPEWGVERSYLTERGFYLVKQSWALLAESAPFVHSVCPKPDEIAVIADRDERTVRTAEAILAGAYPGCDIPIQVTKQAASPLFEPLKARVCKIKNPEALAEKLNKKTEGFPEKFKEELEKIEQITDASFGGPVTAHVTKHKAKLEGGPANASSLTEIFALEWGQFPDENAGWGEVNQEVLNSLMPLRVAVFSAVNRDLELARYRGSALADKIIRSLESGPKYTFLIGHDTNLANLGILFGLNWKLPGRAENENTPGGFLKFEKWLVNGHPEIKVSYSALSPDQIHSAEVTRPPQEVSILPDGVDFSDWAKHAKVRLLETCIAKDAD